MIQNDTNDHSMHHVNSYEPLKYIPVGISRVTLGRQFVDYNPPALGWVYYTLGCLRFFLFTTNCKTIDKLSLLQVALYLH